ncbi:MAG TPA: cytochrome c peroxidase [Chloroflexota bacterium]
MSRTVHPCAPGVLLMCLAAVLLLVGCEQPVASRPAATRVDAPAPSREPISPLPRTVDLDPQRVALGQALFQDAQLSHDNSLSCATCHPLNEAGTDHRPRGVGIYGQPLARNTPTVFNSGFNFRQFWDGRAMTLEDQVDGPVTAAAEMGSTWPEVLGKLNASPTYRAAFNATYPDGLTRDAVRDAIATFERSLVTPNARFDLYLGGNQTAMTGEEIEGYRLFRSYGCVSCHQGANVGGNMFQRIGVMQPYVPRLDQTGLDDRGRFQLTDNPRDDHVFKVPSLRNVALTAPYFHDGSISTLEGAVGAMGRYQLGRQLTGTDVQRLVAFLRTLSGEYQRQPLT